MDQSERNFEEFVREITKFSDIPFEHQGVLFHRIFEAFHPQVETCMLEKAFALLWAERNERDHLLQSLLLTEQSDPKWEFTPKTPREWAIAYTVAATIIQWIPTSVGCSFLSEAFVNGKGSLNYTLPEIKRKRR